MTAEDVAAFYDQMAPLYHLIFEDWERSIARHAQALDAVIRRRWNEGRLPRDTSILDAACGIGTQSLGLARLGYQVAASDLSPAAVQRARDDATQRGLSIAFSVADVRQAYVHHMRAFDIVLACDNALPHLLTDDEILAALSQLYHCTRSGGGCMISVRDYARMERTDQVQLYGIREENGIRYLIFQARHFHGSIYDVEMYFVEDRGSATCTTHVMRTRYYAIETDDLLALMERAGYVDVQRLDGVYFQPLLVGTKPGPATRKGLRPETPCQNRDTVPLER
jgi:2-polyprenyl-3-methyl-5-hydroxy-6-metoxy-1,4-benzoquinol methylase